MPKINTTCPFHMECNHRDCESFCLKKYKSEYYFDTGFIPKNKQYKYPLYIDNDGRDEESFLRLSKIEQDIEQFVLGGNNLYIYSSQAGNGKTSWSFRLLRSYINSVWYKKEMKPIVMFISVPRFLLELKANISQKSDYIEQIESSVLDCDLIVWDDIGSKAGTEFEVSHLLSILDTRINTKKSNIYTSNLNNDDLHKLLGDRLYSRIYNYSECIELVGKDKRGIKND